MSNHVLEWMRLDFRGLTTNTICSFGRPQPDVSAPVRRDGLRTELHLSTIFSCPSKSTRFKTLRGSTELARVGSGDAVLARHSARRSIRQFTPPHRQRCVPSGASGAESGSAARIWLWDGPVPRLLDDRARLNRPKRSETDSAGRASISRQATTSGKRSRYVVADGGTAPQAHGWSSPMTVMGSPRATRSPLRRWQENRRVAMAKQ